MQSIRGKMLFDGYTRARPYGAHLVLIALLVVSQIYFGSLASVAAAATEHPYIIFQDDFEDGEAEDWRINLDSPLGSDWSVELDDSNYVLSEQGHVWAETGDFTWTDYTLEIKVKLLTPGGGHINFRMPGDDSRYYFYFGSGDYVTLSKNDPIENFPNLVVMERSLSLSIWHTIKIVCVGNSIEVYVNDVLTLSYVDEKDPIFFGRIGIEITDGSIFTDDVKVSTTHRLYVSYLINEAQGEINKAKMISADIIEAEEKLAEAQDAFDNENLSGAESFAREAFNLAQHAFVGHVSVNDLLNYPSEYNNHTVEISGTIKGIQYEQGVYRFAVDDGTAAISVTFDGTLGEIKNEDDVKVVGMFDALTETVVAENLEKIESPTEGLYTFLVFKDDFEDGDFAGWRVSVDPEIEGSAWKVERENGNHVLSGTGHGDCSPTGDIEWTDYTLELKIKVIKQSVFINVRAGSKPDARYLVDLSHTFLILSKGMAYLGEQRVTELKRVDINLDPEVWHHLKIVCIENNIVIYLNDQLKIDYTDDDDPYLSGHISFEPSSSSHILFDDVKVSQIASTSVVSDIITYAQSEIDEAKEINADVNSAELKLEQAKQALDQEDYQMVQYLVDEAVWLAKRANVGQISISNLKAMATKCSGHVVAITGTVKNLQANYDVGYKFALDDETSRIVVNYQGALMDIGNDYEVRVTGIFDASEGTVAASNIERLSTPSPIPPPNGGMTWSIEWVAVIISLLGFAVGAGGWIVRTRSARKRKKILFTKLMDDVDAIFSRFKMNALRCQAELYKLREQVLDEFKQGLIDEEKYNILNNRVNDYLKEVEEKIAEEKTA